MEEGFLRWDPAQVASFVQSVLCEDEKHHASRFIDENIDGSLLPYITTQHLHELGIEKLNTRLVIKKAISELITNYYQANPPTSFDDPEYGLNNINVNNNYISMEALLLSTGLIKDMMKKISCMKNLSLLASTNNQVDSLPLSPKTQGDLKRLQDSFIKLKLDLIPLVRLIKELKPLPTPTLDPGPNLSSESPTLSLRSDVSDANDSKTITQGVSVKESDLNTEEISSPTSIFSNRFSSGSLLSMGTGKIIQQSIPKLSEIKANSDFKLQKLPNDTRTISDERPRLVENVLQPKLSKSNMNASSSLSNLSINDSTKLGKPPLKQFSSTNSIKPSNHSSHNLYNHQQTQQQPQNEPLKQLRASSDDSCLKILQQAMKRYHIPRKDWSKYVLVICYGNKERILKLSEKPVTMVKELHELGKHPTIMLRQLAEVTEETARYDDSRIGDDIPGGSL